jgi:1-pyrroline-5-carboxylate dehydrogenase
MTTPQLAAFRVPAIENEPMVSRCKPFHDLPFETDPMWQRSYAVGSAERKNLEAALAQMQQELPFEVPCIVNGKPVCTASPRPKP